jgi:hypothetical protein
MDFKSLIDKIDSIETPPEAVKSPVLPSAIKLDEEHSLKVLAGTKTLTEAADLMEKAVSKAQQKAAGAALAAKRGDIPKSELKGASKEMLDMSTKELEKFAGTKHKGLPKKKTDESVAVSEDDMKVGDTKKSSTGGTIEKTKTGIKHTAKEYDGEDHVEPAQKKASKAGMSGAERREQKAADKAEEKKSKEWEKKYGKGSVTRHKMEDVEIDTEKFKSKFLQMVEAAKKDEKKVKGKKAEEKMDEGSKPDFLDVDKDGDKKEPMKKAAKEADKGEKKDGKKGMTAKQAKYFGKKKTVKESVEPKLSFRDMMKLVVESGGQQQIDPLDKELFAWAERVAKTKIGEGMKAQVYAGLIYERMGGRFEMYDVLAEDQK